MSVQNLRNKFSQNNGTYVPPGLDYRKPTQSPTKNNNNSYNHVGVTAPNFHQQNILRRFNTIQEEPDAVNDKPPVVAKNSSFLHNYLANGSTPAKNEQQIPSKFSTKSNDATNKTSLQSGVASKFSGSKYINTNRVDNDNPSSVIAPKTLAVTKNSSGLSSPTNTLPKSNGVLKSTSPTKPVVNNFNSKFTPLNKPSPLAVSTVSTKLSTVRSPLIENGSSTPTGTTDLWKKKYDETEAKRKTLLTQSQKLIIEKSDMERQVTKLRTDLAESNRELNERTIELSQLRKLSEAMYKEYDQLKQQYELETGTLEKAMERASKWYKENRVLKRKSSALMQKVMSVAPSTLNDLADDTDGGAENDTEMDELLKVVKKLTQEVSRLQAELNKIKLQEFEAQEQTVDLTAEVEAERMAKIRAEQELKELKMKHDSLETVSRKVVEETTELQQRYKKEREDGIKIRNDANKVKSERDVLARQSQVLMMDAASDEKIMALLFEVEKLQRMLTQEKQEHAEQLKDLQDKLESQNDNEQIELYEEKLKLTEAELLCYQQRTEMAESQVEELRQKLEKTVVPPAPCAPPPPPPPPPMSIPPPPPPPPTMSSTNISNIKLKSVISISDDSNPIEEIGNYLGLPPANSKNPPVQNGAIDAIINQIKGGRFSLKATDKETPVKKQEPPPVVNEMMNVLGTLRRNPKRRASFKTAPADVAL